MAITVKIYILSYTYFLDLMPLKLLPVSLYETPQRSSIYLIILLELTLVQLRELELFFFIWLMNSFTQLFAFLLKCLSIKPSFLLWARLSSESIYSCELWNCSFLFRKPLKGEWSFNPLILFLRMVNRRSQEFLLSLASQFDAIPIFIILNYYHPKSLQQERVDQKIKQSHLFCFCVLAHSLQYLLQMSENKANPGNNDKYLTFVSQESQERWKMDARLITFSEFLRHMSDEVDEAQQNLLTIQLPAFLKADEKIINLISHFYAMHNYQSEGIKVAKIKTSGWHSSLDHTSLSFVTTNLEPQPEQLLKRLLNISEYLKLNYLKEVVLTFIASKHYFCYNEIKMQKELEDRRIFYSRQMEINLKRSLMGYAQQFGKDLLEKMKIKEDRRRQDVNRQ